MYTKFSGFLLVLGMLILISGNAAAEVVKGRVMVTAGEAEAFTLKTESGSMRFIQWNSKTSWKNFDKKGGIKANDSLAVNLGDKPGSHLAIAIERVKAALPEGITGISVTELAALLAANTGTAPFIADARPTELYDAGHINGAAAVPLARLEKRIFSLLPQEKERQIIFYDDGSGWGEAPKAAALARKAGHNNIRILAGGLPAWTESGRFPAATSSYIRKAKPAVIDLSSFYAATKGHIEGAANFPLDQLSSKQEFFPTNKQLPFVLYGESDSDALQGAMIIRKWGYDNIAVLYGGSQAWVASAEVLEVGPPSDVISTVSANHGGALPAKDFEQALLSPIMVEIVDVRTAAEQKKSGFPRSIKIPLATLAKRLKELNRNKIQVIFAADAERAEMAYTLLKAENFRVNYFSGGVEFGEEGKYKLLQR